MVCCWCMSWKNQPCINPHRSGFVRDNAKRGNTNTVACSMHAHIGKVCISDAHIKGPYRGMHTFDALLLGCILFQHFFLLNFTGVLRRESRGSQWGSWRGGVPEFYLIPVILNTNQSWSSSFLHLFLCFITSWIPNYLNKLSYHAN